MTKIRRKVLKERRRKKTQNQIQLFVLSIVLTTGTLFLFLYIFGLLFSGPAQIDNTLNDDTGNAEVGVQKMKRLGEKAVAEKLSGLVDIKKHVVGDKHLGSSFHGGIIPMRLALSNDDHPEEKELAQQILLASANLVDIKMGQNSLIEDDRYEGIIAEFCPLNFKAQKNHPPELPMFRDVVDKSGCGGKGGRHVVRVDLKEAVDLIRAFDYDNDKKSNNEKPTILDLKGVVFHESRCGSTLAANSMMALNPEKHRVYSESSPPAMALRRCAEDYSDCSKDGAANLLKDVIYLMGRSNDPKEENLFFKFQSVTSRTMEIFRIAFPTTPWIFLYREPVEVMMSQLKVPRISQAICVRSKNSSPLIKSFIKKSEYSFRDLVDEEFCAIHLATLCESAIRNLEDAEGVGLAVKYTEDLVHDFLDTVFPVHFHTPVSTAGSERVLKISGTYSKNRGRQAEGKYKPDSEQKEKRDSQQIRDAATDFLQPSFDKLEESPYNINAEDE